MKLRGALVVESDDDQDEGERLCDVISLGVAVNVDGVECCSCKRLCHFSYFASSSDTLSPNIFCPNCAAASPTDSSFTLVERVCCPHRHKASLNLPVCRCPSMLFDRLFHVLSNQRRFLPPGSLGKMAPTFKSVYVLLSSGGKQSSRTPHCSHLRWPSEHYVNQLS